MCSKLTIKTPEQCHLLFIHQRYCNEKYSRKLISTFQNLKNEHSIPSQSKQCNLLKTFCSVGYYLKQFIWISKGYT